MTTVVKCPTCQVQVFWNAQSPHRPFCSKRCQLIDLGEWSEENNKISSQLNPSQELDEAAKQEMIEDIEAMLAKNDDFFQ